MPRIDIIKHKPAIQVILKAKSEITPVMLFRNLFKSIPQAQHTNVIYIQAKIVNNIPGRFSF